MTTQYHLEMAVRPDCSVVIEVMDGETAVRSVTVRADFVDLNELWDTAIRLADDYSICETREKNSEYALFMAAFTMKAVIEQRNKSTASN